ncbi:MAG: PTS sugar transporter subunit IIA [Phycisphaeraceae bacterium]|nr:PTS sugar transporter subunit IIA [Phycisphaeraceae bacterium]MCW5763437.1 PTS sugar transporter subunit IIA [Phycisphaeraceae bacterium]
MNLLDILKPEFIRAPLVAQDKQGVINELVDLLTEHGAVSTPAELKAAVWSREQTRTTGIGHGLAIPHGKCAGLTSLAMAIGKPATPLDFDALDGQPVRLVVLLASPPDRTSDHIQALARISKLMAAEELRSRIYAATTAEEIYDLLRSREG